MNPRQVLTVEIYQEPVTYPGQIVVDVQMRGGDARTWSCRFGLEGTMQSVDDALIRSAIVDGIKACGAKVPRLVPPTREVLDGFKRWLNNTILGPRQ